MGNCMLTEWSGVWDMDWMKRRWLPLTRCALSRLRKTGSRWIRQQLCTWYFNWRTETLEISVMRKLMSNMQWTVLALLTISLAAVAQQSAAAPQNPQAVAVQPGAAQSSAAPQASQNLAPPTTMDQVVDRVILREQELIKFLSPRTPVVETYLQNLTQDPQLGPIPQDDHYFLGRMDLSESIDRSDYLQDKGKDEGMEKHLLGEFTKKFKFQYQPLGFSWMIFADRNDFDRQHYDFRYARREFLGDVRCLVFDLTPKKDAGRGRFL